MREKILQLHDDYMQMDKNQMNRERMQNKENKKHNCNPGDKHVTIPFNAWYKKFREDHENILPNKEFKWPNLVAQARFAKEDEVLFSEMIQIEEKRLEQQQKDMLSSSRLAA